MSVFLGICNRVDPHLPCCQFMGEYGICIPSLKEIYACTQLSSKLTECNSLHSDVISSYCYRCYLFLCGICLSKETNGMFCVYSSGECIWFCHLVGCSVPCFFSPSEPNLYSTFTDHSQFSLRTSFLKDGRQHHISNDLLGLLLYKNMFGFHSKIFRL